MKEPHRFAIPRYPFASECTRDFCKVTTLSWCTAEMSQAVGLTEKQMLRAFRDARTLSKVVEMRLCNELGMSLAIENGIFDVQSSDGDLTVEVRSMGEDCVHFSPSGMRGKSRKFDPVEFERRLGYINAFFVYDAKKFPQVTVWSVPRWWVLERWKAKKLSKVGSIRRHILNKKLR